MGSDLIPRSVPHLKIGGKFSNLLNPNSSLAIQTTQDESGEILKTVGKASFTSRRGSNFTSGKNGNISPMEFSERSNRFMTPHRSNSIDIRDNSSRYLTAGKMEKESVSDYVNASRKLLIFNLVQNDRK